ncbi:MAG: UDP-N-acetylmuramoyl-L-alanyl-D-glutamate--2,6-diaminopimelate ligase, partial [Chloroflexi bacterium]
MEKRLSELLSYLPNDAILAVHGDAVITAPVVETDADVLAGGVFVARRGASVDGHTFIPKAIERGAAAIVGELDMQDLPVPYVQVRDARAILGLLAAAFFDFPSRKLVVIGVTGTDGKTTTSHLLHSILKQAAGIHPGLISTIEADLGGATVPTGLHVTTPGAPQVQSLLAQMVANGVTHCVLEMTSHGLAQGRLTGVDIDVAVMTNVTHEHLDFHGSWEAYRDAKAIMFHMLKASQYKPDQPKVAVVNADDRSSAHFAAIPADKTLLYGIESEAEFRPEAIEYAPDATRFTVNGHQFAMHLVGEFNIYNALAAIAAARGLGIDWQAIIAGVEAVRGVSGRMERIDEGQDFTAIVDFAHTPNALRRALEAGRTMLPEGGRLIAVFGSAGLRDVEKRRLMAETSAQLADITVLTAEDPRTESLDDILQMMADGCLAHNGVEGETFFRIPDRGEAIYRACQMAKAGDIVMVCGKGHEQSMCFGTTEYPWDDRNALRAALRG